MFYIIYILIIFKLPNTIDKSLPCLHISIIRYLNQYSVIRLSYRVLGVKLYFQSLLKYQFLIRLPVNYIQLNINNPLSTTVYNQIYLDIQNTYYPSQSSHIHQIIDRLIFGVNSSLELFNNQRKTYWLYYITLQFIV